MEVSDRGDGGKIPSCGPSLSAPWEAESLLEAADALTRADQGVAVFRLAMVLFSP